MLILYDCSHLQLLDLCDITMLDILHTPTSQKVIACICDVRKALAFTCIS